MTIKRAILSLLTVVVILFTGTSLWASWQQPQIQSRLELYQTNLLLRAGQLQDSSDTNLTKASKTLVGEEPLTAAIKQYQEARELAQKNLEKAKNQLSQLAQQPSTTPAPPKPQEQIAPITNTSRTGQQKQLQKSLNQIDKLIAELDLRIGILQAQQQTASALTTWQNLVENSPQTALSDTANVLIGLWSNPPRLFPDAERLIQENLDGWFQGRAFAQLYQIQQRQDALQTLQAVEQEQAQQAVLKLAIISTIPAIAGLTGLALLVYLVQNAIATSCIMAFSGSRG